jgi:hypothetical protein
MDQLLECGDGIGLSVLLHETLAEAKLRLGGERQIRFRFSNELLVDGHRDVDVSLRFLGVDPFSRSSEVMSLVQRHRSAAMRAGQRQARRGGE